MLDNAHYMGSTGLWDLGIRGQQRTVAVLDSGARAEDLEGTVALLNPEADPEDLSRVVAWSADITQPGGDARDNLGHGTEMSAFILSQAPGCRLANVKVIDDYNQVTRETATRGLEECLKRRSEVHVINISIEIPRRRFWRTLCTQEQQCLLCSKVNEVVEQGIPVVVAAGNSGPDDDTITCPGNARLGISVGASTGPFAAPELPRSRWWDFSWLLQPQRHNTNLHSGTSVSSAFVSGGIALLLSAFPDLSIEQIKKALAVSTTQINAPRNAVGHGVVHFYRAFRVLKHLREDGILSPEIATIHFQQGQLLEQVGEVDEATQRSRKLCRQPRQVLASITSSAVST